MFKKLPKPRKFDYQPRYYKPERDDEEMRRRRLGFRSNLTRTNEKKRSPLVFIILLIIIIYIFLKYQGII